MNNFWQRTIFGAVYVGVITAAFFLNVYLFYAVLGVLMLVSFYEYYNLLLSDKFSTFKVLGFLIATINGITLLVDFDLIIYTTLGGLLLGLVLVFFLKQSGASWNQSWLWLFSFAYIMLPILVIGATHSESYYYPTEGINATPTVFILFTFIWINDTGAYLVGRWLGKHPLAPKISPKKTWEGFFGGAILTIAAGLIIHRLNLWTLSLPFTITTALIFSIFGPLGDLFESSLKRKAGVKDSGNIIPGHGGILDRLDGLLLAFLALSVFMYIAFLVQVS